MYPTVLAVLDVQKLIKVLRAPSTTHPHVEGKNLVYATKVQENTAQYSSETAPPAPLRKVAVVSVSVDDVISVGVSRAHRSRRRSRSWRLPHGDKIGNSQKLALVSVQQAQASACHHYSRAAVDVLRQTCPLCRLPKTGNLRQSAPRTRAQKRLTKLGIHSGLQRNEALAVPGPPRRRRPRCQGW